MPSLTTLSLVLCLAVSHVTCQIWFPDQPWPGTGRNNNNNNNNNNHQYGAAARNNGPPVMVEDLRQRGVATQNAQRTPRSGFVTQLNGIWKTQPYRQNELTSQQNDRRSQPSMQWNQQNSQWNSQRTDDRLNQQRNGNNGQWNPNYVLAKRINAVPVNVNRITVTNVKPRITDEEQEFDDYWLEDDLKDQEEAAAVTTTTQPSVAVNEIADVKPRGPSRCVWAIISCCRPAAVTSDIRYACFEAVGCHGAFWDSNPCSKQMMAAALQATASFFKVPTGDNE